MKALSIGDTSQSGNVVIIDEDRLCYLVRNTSKGAQGLRTISKALLGEFVDYISKNPEKSANEAREALCGLTDIDRFEYGYASTLVTMAKMSLAEVNKAEETTILAHSDIANQFALLVFKHLYHIDKLQRIRHLLAGQNKNKTLSDSALSIKMYGLFIECTQKELRKANEGKGNYRYFNNGFYIDNENLWYLTSGWSKPEKGKSEPTGRTMYNLKKLVEHYYNDLSITIKDKENSEYILNGKEHDNKLSTPFYNSFVPYITAIKSKPFLLLAGISGTGKSRIVRELAKACWDENSEEYGAHKPKNFEMIQVKPNWHDSSELIGYISRVSGEPVFVAGDFLKFVAKAWENEDIPYFLCLDEMNLAPVEQYFAEYLSVIESRKADGNGTIVTDPILKQCDEQWYFDLTAKLTDDEGLRNQFNKKGIMIPQNFIVIGTVNMDETTFSFSRKVLDRAMTIEMNEVDLYGGLEDRHENIGKLDKEQLIGTAVEGADVYRDNKEVCDKVLEYLSAVNNVLEGTPFKVAYRTRNEFLLYVVNNLPYNKDKDGNYLSQEYVIARALDEITSMKILSRIEGDDSKVSDNKLKTLSNVIEENLNKISDERKLEKSVSLSKIEEMKNRLSSGYTSFWS